MFTKFGKKATLAVVTATALSGATAATAGEFQVSPHVSTLGVGVDAGYKFNDKFGVRGQINKFEFSRTESVEGEEFDIDGQLLTKGVFVDVYPFAGNLRTSFGLIDNGNGATMDRSFDTSFEFGGQTFTAPTPTKVKGDVSYDQIAPAFVIGYHGNLAKNLSLGLDLGVMKHGKASVDLDSSGALANDPTFLAEVESAKNDITDLLDQYEFYPIASVAVTFRF